MKRMWRWMAFPLVVAIGLVGCDGGEGVQAVPATGVALVVTTDYQTGAYSLVDVETGEAFINIEVIHQDASCRMDPLTGTPFLVGRQGADAVDILDPDEDWTIGVEYSVGAGTNPQDIAVATPDRAYVALYEEDYLLVVHPLTGVRIGQVDLSMYADEDGVPEVGWLAAREGNVYALLQRLDRMDVFAPTDYSLMVVLDGASGEVVEAVELAGTNPSGKLRYSDAVGAFVVVSTGHHSAMGVGSIDGGVELFDPRAGAGGFVVTAEALGGDIVDAAMVSSSTGYAIVGVQGGTNGRTRLVSFDAQSGEMGEVLIDSDGWDLGFMELSPDGTQLWVADRTPQRPGIRIFDTATGVEQTDSPVDVGLPPYMICFIPSF